jgi:hypothetical protein
MTVQKRPARCHATHFRLSRLCLKVQIELNQTLEARRLEFGGLPVGQLVQHPHRLGRVYSDHRQARVDMGPHPSGPSAPIYDQNVMSVEIFAVEPPTQTDPTDEPADESVLLLVDPEDPLSPDLFELLLELPVVCQHYTVRSVELPDEAVQKLRLQPTLTVPGRRG